MTGLVVTLGRGLITAVDDAAEITPGMLRKAPQVVEGMDTASDLADIAQLKEGESAGQQALGAVASTIFGGIASLVTARFGPLVSVPAGVLVGDAAENWIEEAARPRSPAEEKFWEDQQRKIDEQYSLASRLLELGFDPDKITDAILNPRPSVDPFEDRGGPTGPNSLPPSPGVGRGTVNPMDAYRSDPQSPLNKPGAPPANEHLNGDPTRGENGNNSNSRPSKVENPKSGYWEKYSEDKKKMGDGGKKAAADEKAANESKKVTSKPDPRTEAREEKREQKEASDAAKEKEKHNEHLKEKNYDREHPIVLDLDGTGVEISEISRSNVFMDSGNDGLLHRTAWAAAGNGVLFFDANLDGQIGEKREYIFTEWDPTATSDLEALRAKFDTNGDGKLTAADADFAKFKVMVSNADGSMTAQTLAALGITEINLTGDATHIVLPDGSVITGQTTYKKADGSTGTVADTALVAEADGNHVTQTVSTDGSGNRVVVSKSYDASGNLAYAITSVTSPTGNAITNSYDDTRAARRGAFRRAGGQAARLSRERIGLRRCRADGVTDRIQTISKVVNGDGKLSVIALSQTAGASAS